MNDYKKLSPSGAMPSIAQVNKAVRLLKQNKIAEAEILLLEAEELYPTNEVVYRTLGALYEKTKDFERAAKYFKCALNLNPIKKDLFMRLGYAQLSARLNDEAKRTFEKALKVFPVDSEVIAGYGMALYRLERYADARVELVKAFSLDAHNLNALFLTATIDVMFGDYERAESRLSLLVKLAPITPHLYEYAKLKNLKQDYDAALELAQRALDINPKFLPAYLLMAEVYHSKFDFAGALDCLQKAENEELFSSALYLSRANIYMYKEDFALALDAYKKSLEYEQSKTVDLKILICQVLLDDYSGQEDVINILEQEVEDEDDTERQAVAYLLQGVFKFKQQNFAQAEMYFRKALQITLKLPVVYYLLALIYQELGDDYKSDKYYNLTIEKNPYHENAYRSYIAYLLERKDFEGAKYKSKKALKLFPENSYFANIFFYASFCLVDEMTSEYNVKELLKLAEKLEENSTFLYANEKQILLKRIN